MEKSVEYWTRKEFESLPCREWNQDIGEFNSLVILPTKDIHDSGFRQMDFVAVKGTTPICRLSGCSDVIHIDGIGGYGYRWIERTTDRMKVDAKGWCIDCLKTSGLLRIFSDGHLKAGEALSSFDLFTVGPLRK